MPDKVRSGKPIDPGVALARDAWNMMKGIDWNALPIVCDLLGVSDPELLINQLLVIRDHQESDNG